MQRDSHYNPILFHQLNTLVEAGDYAQLASYLGRLSHAQHRTAGYILGERIGPALGPESFWPLFLFLVQLDAKAFLVTLLKSVTEGMKRGTLSLSDSGFGDAALWLGQSHEDTRKTLLTLLPALTDVGQIRSLFVRLNRSEMSAWIPFLLKCFHPATAFVLLQALHYVEHDRPFLVRVARLLIANGDSLSFNVASLIKSIYGLDELRGTFSLRLQPFQLSRIEGSYEAFCEAVKLR